MYILAVQEHFNLNRNCVLKGGIKKYMDRLHKFYEIDENEAERICKIFDSSLTYEPLKPIHNDIRTSNFILKASGESFFLKLYNNGIENIELSIYSTAKTI